MIRVLIYPLQIGQPAMFARTFEREIDAADYIEFWKRLGNCHVRRA